MGIVETRKVKIKDWETMVEEFGLTALGSIDCENLFIPEMEKELPDDRIITVRNEGGEPVWRIPETGSEWYISDDMIEEFINEEKGEKENGKN